MSATSKIFKVGGDHVRWNSEAARWRLANLKSRKTCLEKDRELQSQSPGLWCNADCRPKALLAFSASSSGAALRSERQTDRREFSKCQIKLRLGHLRNPSRCRTGGTLHGSLWSRLLLRSRSNTRRHRVWASQESVTRAAILRTRPGKPERAQTQGHFGARKRCGHFCI